MAEDKTELEKPTERIIELNEWFTPFADYDQVPPTQESTSTGVSPDVFRSKMQSFELANVSRFRAVLWWDQEFNIESPNRTNSNYLLILPNSEKIVKGNELKREQERM